MKVISPPPVLVATLVVAFCGSLPAQVAPASPPSPAPADSRSEEAVVVLSPFTVDTSQDRGYSANNTLSGSRLSAPLEITPAAISVFNPEFIRDIGATDLEASLRYGTNTERDFEERGAIATGNILYDNDVVIRMRGQPNATLARNYFRWFINSEYYNVGRVEFSRGPNSILFGLGSPAGVINTSTKQAEFRNAGEVTLRVDDNEGYSGQLDVNHQLTSTFALRLNTLYERGKTWRWGEFSDKEFAHLAGTWAATPKTRFRFDVEKGNKDQVFARPWLQNNGFQRWLEAGRPAFQQRGDPFDAGHDSYSSTRPFWVVNENSDEIADWRGMAISGGSFGSSLAAENPPWGWDYAISDFTLVPREASMAGPDTEMNIDVETYSLFVEHEIIDDLFVELAYNKQEDTRFFRWTHDWNTPVRFDPNVTLPNGANNPYFGQLYLEGNHNENTRVNDVVNLRATLAYEKDFGNIWGSHSFAFLAQETELNESIRAQGEFNLNAVPGVRLTDGQNRIFRRTYLDFEEGPRGMLAAEPINAGGVTSGYLDTRNFRKREELESFMLAMQNKWWSGRFVTTAGIRRDSLTERSVDNSTNTEPITGVAPPAVLPTAGNRFEGDTKTYGAVFRVTDWLSLVANVSDNFEPQGGVFGPDGVNIGNFSGEGEDFGVRFQLWDKRIYATVTAYETASRNRGVFVRSEIPEMINRLRQTYGQPILTGGRDSEDSTSEGVEYEVTANLLPNWTLHANFTDTTTRVENKLPRYRALIAAERAQWDARPSDPLFDPVPGFFETVGSAVEVIDTVMAETLRDEGLKPRHLIRNSFNVFTRYSFEGGVADGWFVGGGFNYRSAPLLTYTRNLAGNSVPVYGDAQLTMDGLVGYETKIRDGRMGLRVQMNVQNLLDDDDVIDIEGDIGLVSGEFVTRRYRFQKPREITLSAILTF